MKDTFADKVMDDLRSTNDALNKKIIGLERRLENMGEGNIKCPSCGKSMFARVLIYCKDKI